MLIHSQEMIENLLFYLDYMSNRQDSDTYTVFNVMETIDMLREDYDVDIRYCERTRNVYILLTTKKLYKYRPTKFIYDSTVYFYDYDPDDLPDGVDVKVNIAFVVYPQSDTPVFAQVCLLRDVDGRVLHHIHSFTTAEHCTPVLPEGRDCTGTLAHPQFSVNDIAMFVDEYIESLKTINFDSIAMRFDTTSLYYHYYDDFLYLVRPGYYKVANWRSENERYIDLSEFYSNGEYDEEYGEEEYYEEEEYEEEEHEEEYEDEHAGSRELWEVVT